MKLKLTMALSAACLFFSIAGAEAVTLSSGNEIPAVQSASRSAVSVEDGAPLTISLAVAASAARG